MTAYNYRIHPAIGISRVGNSEEYYIAPESMAGSGRTGGLPIRAGTEDTTITSRDIRDDEGAFKRQAARFKIYQYPEQTAPESYPMCISSDDVKEITVGSKVGDKTVAKIVWTVHVANKKSNTFVLVEDVDAKTTPPVYAGICGFAASNLPPLRNWTGAQPANADKIARSNDAARRKALIIDPGPRTVSGTNATPVSFDASTPATYCKSDGQVVTVANYPKSFPADSFSSPANAGDSGLNCPSQQMIDTLGELRTDDKGRLLVLGGYGRACGWNPQANPPATNLPNSDPLPLAFDVNNNQWFDDASDGPVTAVIVFDDGSVQEVHAGAWVVTTDPAYAPQTPNVVSLYDDIYDSWIRKLNLVPEILSGTTGSRCNAGIEELPSNWFTQYNSAYKPQFETQLNPIFQSVALQRWNINLNPTPGISGHETVGSINRDTDPNATPLQNLAFIRLPGDSGASQEWNPLNPLMPAALGDANQSFLTVTPTQYFFLSQWASPPENPSSYEPPPLGPGELLDKAVLVNCLGGRFSPGIDLTFIVRQPDLYIKNWQTSGTGPFRIKPAPIDYQDLPADGAPVLTQGYVPLHTGNAGSEPGDISKWMSIPWHTDYNSCATHLPSPNPNIPGSSPPTPNANLFWSWPAQRPVAVYVAKEIKDNGGLLKNGLPLQQWSIRGENTGTMKTPAQQWGRYQSEYVVDMLKNWPRIGVVMNAHSIDTAEDGAPFPDECADYYLEAQSQLQATAENPPVVPVPNFNGQLPGSAT